MKNNAFKFFIAVLGFVFGFSSNVAAQYGAPPSRFKINGFVLSEDNKPLKNINVKINKGKTRQKTLSTNSNGEFSFIITEDDILDTIYIVATDIDGEENGAYQEKDTICKIAYSDLKDIKNSDIDGIIKKPLKMHLKSEAIKPKESDNSGELK